MKSNNYKSTPGRTDGLSGEPGRRTSSASMIEDKKKNSTRNLNNSSSSSSSSNNHDNNNHSTYEHKQCHQCVTCTKVTAEHSRTLTLCTHGTECISAATHYHNCRPLCGYARRASERRKKVDSGGHESAKRENKPKRHYKCKLEQWRCKDMACHYHVGRAPVKHRDCTMRNLRGVEGKEASEAIELYNQLDDAPVVDSSSSNLSISAAPFYPKAQSAPASTTRDAATNFALPFSTRPDPYPYSDEAEEEKTEWYDSDPPKFSTTLGCGTSPDSTGELTDDWTSDDIFNAIPGSVPSSEEKKPASATVTDQAHVSPPNTADEKLPDPSPSGPDDSAPGAPAPEALLDPLRVKKYVVFTTHSVRGRREISSLWRRFLLKLSCVSERDVVLHNDAEGCITDNVLTLAQKEVTVAKWFWQNWDNREPKVVRDSISIFAGTFTHADYADVFEELVVHVLCNEAFTKTETRFLDSGKLRETVRCRAQDLIARHPHHRRYVANQKVLSNTITFVNNQLLLRGLLDEARKPQGIAPAIVDFRKGVVSKMFPFTARHSKSAARRQPLSHATLSTGPSR